MKKIVFTLFLFSAAYGFTACNDDPDLLINGFGAYYPLGNYIENYDGTEYALLDSYGAGLTGSRYYIEFLGNIPEGSLSGPGEVVEVSNVNGNIFFPLEVTGGGVAFDDPVLLTDERIEQTNREPVMCAVDFLVLTLPLPLYDNKEGESDYAAPDFYFEQLNTLPGANGQIDTLNLRMYLDSNREEDAPLVGSFEYRTVLDLQSLDVAYEDKDYILKVNLKTSDDPDGGDAKPAYLLGKWNPAKPYLQ